MLMVLIMIPFFSSTSLKINAAEKDKDVIFSNSFEKEEIDNLLESQVNEGKGMKNVAPFSTDLVGEVSRFVQLDSIKGSEDYKAGEAKEKLFDRNKTTKFLTAENGGKSAWVSFSLDKERVINSYSLTSANDRNDRDPKTWKLYGSHDNEDWIELDVQKDQKWDKRYQEKTFLIEDPAAYQFYKLDIEENNGADMTQLADFMLATGEETDDQKEMTSVISTGPSHTWNQKKDVGWTGKQALQVSGQHTDAGEGHAYNELFVDVDIPINKDSHLSYVMFPAIIGSADFDYDYSYTPMYMAIDLQFTDGTYLSDLTPKDRNGNILSPEEQGKSRTLTYHQWNKISANIGQVAEGKTVEKILVGYENSDKEEAAEFLAYFDDIEISNYKEEEHEKKSDYVNILRGTNDSGDFSRGLTVPAVTVPHGFNFWAPVTNSGSNTLYDYQLNGNKFQHITVSHEPSIWVGDRGTWQYMVNSSIDIEKVANGSDIDNKAVASSFSHDNEEAKAHYYRVLFDEESPAAGTQIEVTPSDHGSITRFRFSNDSEFRNVVFDSVRADGNVSFADDNKSFSAYTDHTGNGMTRMYVYGEFDQEFDQSKVQNTKQGIVSFASSVESVEMKTATSFISSDQAKKNLQLELDDENFDSLKNRSQNEWDERLDTVEVEGASHDQLVTLYSNIYRLFAYPNNYSENTGSAEEPVWEYSSPYSGSKENPDIKEGKLYVNNGFWDTYRTTWSAYSLFAPEQYNEMLDGLTQHYRDNEWVPRWIAPGGTNSMVGTSSDVIFGDAVMKNADFDAELAFQSVLKNGAVVSNNLTNGGRNQLNTSIFSGYVASDYDVRKGFSWSMEGYINDYGIAQMAEELGYEDESAYYRNRALNYVKLFDKQDTPTSSWFRGKRVNGEWSVTDEAFDPRSWAQDYTETNAYNMSVSVPHDGQGLANLYGGRDGLGEKIDSIIETPGVFLDDRSIIHEMREAREIKLGQLGQSNQPSHHILYMYNHAGQPWKTQQYVRDVLQRTFVGSDFGQGYIGDEDNGEMSAWYLLSAAGFYPLNLASNEYAIGSPLFTKLTFHLENGEDLVINAPNNSRENVYVQGVKLNGEEHAKNYFTHDEISEGAVIDFDMGNEPNKAWGSDEEAAPTSLTTDEQDPNPIDDMTTDGVTIKQELNEDREESVITEMSDPANLFDNTSDSNADVKDQSLIYQFSNNQHVEMYTLTSGNSDMSFSSITVSGSIDGEQWNELDKREDVDFAWDKYTRPFKITEDNQGAYQYYKLDFEGGNNLAEIELLGHKDDTVEAESIEINTDALTIVKKGESVQPEVVITPENTTDKQVNWEVQKTDMAEVLEDGTITAKEPGTTKITATTSNGKTASFTLRVTK